MKQGLTQFCIALDQFSAAWKKKCAHENQSIVKPWHPKSYALKDKNLEKIVFVCQQI